MPVDELTLEVIAHSDRAVFHSIGSRKQVSGTDVILAHRLLKNSVSGNEYLLLSDAAYRDSGRGMGLESPSPEGRGEARQETRAAGAAAVACWVT